MDIDAAREFLRANHRGVLATRKGDGSPQLSPIAITVDDEGRALVSSRETAFKTKNLRRDPAASVCVVNDGWYGDWIQIDGRAEIVSLPEAMELLVQYYRSIAGEHPDWDDYRAAMERERRVMIRIAIERAGPTRAG
jgi:PPOX class probable F420-dependent enzyme